MLNLVVPIAMGITAAAVAAFSVLAWWKGYWRVRRRVHYTLFALATVVMVWILWYWNAIAIRQITVCFAAIGSQVHPAESALGQRYFLLRSRSHNHKRRSVIQQERFPEERGKSTVTLSASQSPVLCR